MRIYFASALFNSRETLFNSELGRRLESKEYGDGHEVVLPQRDGFEFSSLGLRLEAKLSEAEAQVAVQRIIYVLDMGCFLSNSNAVVAVLDEPLDEGVLIEMAYARRLGLPVVGVRTDSRCPFGNIDDVFGGIHFFAAFQCTSFIRVGPLQQSDELDDLARAILACLQADPLRQARRRDGDPLIESAVEALFSGIDCFGGGLHEDSTIEQIVSNYLVRRESIDKLVPDVLRPQ